MKVDFLDEAEKINLPKRTGGRRADQVRGRSVLMGNGQRITENERRRTNINQPIFCPTYGGKLSVNRLQPIPMLAS